MRPRHTLASKRFLYITLNPKLCEVLIFINVLEQFQNCENKHILSSTYSLCELRRLKRIYFIKENKKIMIVLENELDINGTN